MCLIAPSSAGCTTGQIRLSTFYQHSYGRSEGRVEYCYNNQWGTVCDDGIDDDETDTICVQLGYSRAFAWDNLNNM